MRSENTLILFSKTPNICRVKTRMYPRFNYRECLYMHKKLTQHNVSLLKNLTHINSIIYTSRDRSHYCCDFFSALKVKKQYGLDLGQRMFNALRDEFKHARRVVIIGADCIELDIDYIQQAFNALKTNRDFVLGPTHDGGYILLGARANYKPLFEKISWGTPKVLKQTIEILKMNNKQAHLLPPLTDVDTFADIQALSANGQLPAWAGSLLAKHHQV